jgi:hypothetical protein
MIEQRAASNDDGEIRDNGNNLITSDKKKSLVEELSHLNIRNAATIALKNFSSCMIIKTKDVIIINEQVYEDFYYLSFFDLS